MTIETFLNMGGYAQYVWPAFSIALVVLVANVVVPLMRQRTISKGGYDDGNRPSNK